MLGAIGYKTKKALKEVIGKPLQYEETALVGGPEYKANGKVTMVGPNAYTARNWYANITMADGKIAKVQ